MKKTFLILVMIVVISGCTATSSHKLQFTIRSESMLPGLKPGQTVTLLARSSAAFKPKRWDIVAIAGEMTSDELWFTRVVGFPGEHIDVVEGTILINGVPEVPPKNVSRVHYSNNVDGVFIMRLQFTRVKLQNEQYYVLSDNQNNSKDSRYFGPIMFTNIVGTVVLEK